MRAYLGTNSMDKIAYQSYVTAHCICISMLVKNDKMFMLYCCICSMLLACITGGQYAGVTPPLLRIMSEHAGLRRFVLIN